MIVFPSMLLKAAHEAGMKVPADPDNFEAKEFMHFTVFCNAQLARPLSFWGEHWENAKTIAAIPEAELETITLDDLIAKGLHFTS